MGRLRGKPLRFGSGDDTIMDFEPSKGDTKESNCEDF